MIIQKVVQLDSHLQVLHLFGSYVPNEIAASSI